VRGRTALFALAVAAAFAVAVPVCASANPTASTSGGGFTVTKKVPTAVTLGIGWFYTDSPDFPQSKVGPLVLHWAPCATAGGVQIGFPAGAQMAEPA